MQMQITKKYTNGDVTVVWKPHLCRHSTLCWKGLPKVFAPNRRPWVRMDGATGREIMDQVERCPSGALTYFLNIDGEKTGKDQ